MIDIKNDFLTVEIDPVGAQLTHVINRKTGFDYIWNGAEWPKHAPILFPAIGRSTEDSYLLDGRLFPMQQHGFASDFKFDVYRYHEDCLTLRLNQNEETIKSYPFKFELYVIFKLEGSQLQVSFEVKNTDSKTLSFALGFHPAFNLPGNFTDYHLQMQPETVGLKQFEIVKNPFPYRTGRLVDFGAANFVLTREMFAAGLVILDNDISQVKLFSEKNDLAVTMDLADFPYLCLWTKEDADLPYLCIEPFQGLPDIVDQKQELLEKEGNVKLAAGGQRQYQVNISFEGGSN